MADWRRARSLFPVTELAIHLDHAGGAPLPSRVEEAVHAFTDRAARGADADPDAPARELERVRGRIAKLLAAQASEVAFVPHAAQGLERVALQLDWRRGDVVVVGGDADRRPWRRLAGRGVELHHVPLDKRVLRVDQLDAALAHPRVRLLALDAVDASHGARAPLEAAGRLCRERGVIFAVDASCQLGGLALDANALGVDLLACDAHRFLLGLAGVGVLFRSRRSSTDRLSASERFESGPANAIGITALGAGVDLLLEQGIASVEQRNLALGERLLEGLERRGITAAAPREHGRSGIVAFAIDGEPAARTAARLRERRIRVAVTPAGVRVSPHFYVAEAEIDALLDAL